MKTENGHLKKLKIFFQKCGNIWDMRNINWKVALWIILMLALTVSGIEYLCFKNQFCILSYIFNSLSTTVTVISVVIVPIFIKSLWKCRIFNKWLVLIPNLNGKWEGVISSEWINPDTKKKCEFIQTSLIIKQSLFNISCIMKTQETQSRSITSDFRIDENNQIHQLVYIYETNPSPKVRERNPIQHGTIVFDIIKENDSIKLEGNYWTDRKTTGEIKLTKK
jgi:hypothetical protein